MNLPLRVLCLDIEGGFGGSSRSLYESLRHMDRAGIEPEIWCRRDGPVRTRYEALGITCRVSPGMPRMNSLPRLSRNLHGYALCLRDLIAWSDRSRLIDAANDRFDVVHFNHEGLWPLALALRRHHRKPQTMHVRTMNSDTVFSRWQARRMVRASDRLVFITENEKSNVQRLARREISGAVIYNIASVQQAETARDPRIPEDRRFKVAVLSNFAWVRGTDRVVEIAEALVTRGRRDILFVVAGDMHLRGSLPGELGRIAGGGGTIADHATGRGVGDMFCFLGHVAAPESVLAACDVLLKPTREANPWGRDIIEGLAAGKPVISIGRYDRFVQTDETGFLLQEYDAGAVADILTRLASDHELTRRLGKNAKVRVADLCDGPARARDLLEVWRAAVAERVAL